MKMTRDAIPITIAAFLFLLWLAASGAARAGLLLAQHESWLPGGGNGGCG